MKYRHACHAGNFADVVKHVVLVATLARLVRKERALFYLDTHAGRARYDLRSRDTAAEAAHGILRLAAADLRQLPLPVQSYLALIRGFAPENAGLLRWYPGSPCIAAALLRPGDRAAFCDVEPSAAALLEREFRGDARIGVHCRDGIEALGALLPPPERRGLVLIDPPYEQQEADLERVADALATTAGRWPEGVLLAWYPIKLAAVIARFHRRLLGTGLRRVLAVELCVHPDDSRAGLNGSGMLLINPPWQLDEDLRATLPALHRLLASDSAGRWRVDWLAGE
ncbi:MAG TPA: 23S rRNA (adenine(2030)-N(6))-methyltransferase RlmJ [Steroidobacteraceae bacterium]|nr:23S rRNA (adenine(2030)-N(6))-methyltransferase RlmJ [Steroidobacteraceae bacterium]